MNRAILFISSLFILLFVNGVQASTLKVAADGTGQYTTIQPAIDAAVNGDTVIVGNGIYSGEGNTEMDFKGKAITVISEGGAGKCIIDCKKNGRAFLFYHNETASSVLSGFSIINSNTKDGGAVRCGKYNPGSVYEPPKRTEETGSPVIENCLFRDNRTDYAGAGIVCNSSSPVIKNCDFLNNKAEQYGGAIALMNESDARITGCGFSGNSAYSGGAVYAEDSKGELAGLYAENNTAEYDGAGICLRKSNFTIDRCTVLNNTSYWGAGISVKINSEAVIKSCLVVKNKGQRGGGIYTGKSIVTIAGCTVTENSAAGGNNSFPCFGGIYAEDVAPTIINSIIWGNTDGDLGFNTNDIIPQISYTDINENFTGEGNINTDPLFAGNGDYHLSANSPCIGKGTDDKTSFLDRDGNLRSGDGIFTPGAYEEPVVGGKDTTVKQSSPESGCFIKSIFF